MLNAELADTLGNLLNRTCARALNPKQVFPHFSHEAFQKLTESNVQHLIEETSILPEKVKQHFLEGYFYRGLDCIMACLRDTNAFMQFNKPWELAKHTDDDSKEKLATVLHIALEVLRISGILLQPVIPTLSSSLLTRLGVPVDKRGWHNLQCFESYHNLHNPLIGQSLTPSSIPLFERRKQ
ncbi:methionine--tRNA ligase, mitochondrial-like [Stegodyphus dumicola]|uniref:methionine--tRNA ligase, mitochondrial-like n=1 Tax=Stegodyphus dumicola TaxID=202533 RepID=UPI0015A92AB8|nr:methionine--tRNA ligase, mitochondrial-like [Stegodyphus dumicola]